MRKLVFLTILVIPFISCKTGMTNSSTSRTGTTVQLLTGKTWKAEEIRVQFSNDSKTYYKRGNRNNTANYDSDSLKFNTENTGFYYYLGEQYSTKWNFTDDEKTKMTLIIYQEGMIMIYLENISLTETNFKYAQYSLADGISYLASGTRTPN